MSRRDQILDTALRLFLALGYDGTTIADIRQGSGATTGSIYHAFAGKEAIALALFRRAVDRWSAAGGPVPTSATPAETAVKASVRGLLDWGLADPDHFRFMDEMRFLEPSRRQGAPLAGFLAEGWEEAESVFRAGVARGEARDLPWPVARAMMVGPAYDFLRSVHAGRATGVDLGRARAELIEAAWQAVRA